MAIPTTATFDLTVDELIEAAANRAGGAQQTGSELRSSLRALNLLFQDITNRGMPLWQMELYTLALDPASVSYVLPADTVDVVKDAMVKDTASATAVDIPVQKISYDTYLSLADKNTLGIPTQFMLERGLAQPTIRLYPKPNKNTYELLFWRLKKPRDAKKFIDQVDYPTRMQPVLVSGLAYYLAMDRPQLVDAAMRAELKAKFEEDYRNAAAEYVDRSDLRLEVDLTCYSGAWW